MTKCGTAWDTICASASEVSKLRNIFKKYQPGSLNLSVVMMISDTNPANTAAPGIVAMPWAI